MNAPNPFLDPLSGLTKGIQKTLARIPFWSRNSEMKSHDALLRNLMQAAGISTWRELRQKAKLSRGALNALRTGQAEKLKLADLNRAASIL
ncbi:helix-turn-helix domain-containing protein [Synechococcus sp. RC10B2]|uniref:helix-turn-helix domain-containing protein n=1 Tax=unclassified Synechococcus TaxID=2626047 RepID=UPI0039C7143C